MFKALENKKPLMPRHVVRGNEHVNAIQLEQKPIEVSLNTSMEYMKTVNLVDIAINSRSMFLCHV